MATLTSTTNRTSSASKSDSTAIIIPGEPDPLTISYTQLDQHIRQFQSQLASLGLKPQEAISIALPNSFELVVAFLGTSWQRCIAAPLNPAYKQDEFDFYIEDLGSVLALVPKGAVEQDTPAVRAAKRRRATVAECYWDDVAKEVVLRVVVDGARLKERSEREVEMPMPDDIALVLHTSGTTGRPKAVRCSRTMSSMVRLTSDRCR